MIFNFCIFTVDKNAAKLQLRKYKKLSLTIINLDLVAPKHQVKDLIHSYLLLYTKKFLTYFYNLHLLPRYPSRLIRALSKLEVIQLFFTAQDENKQSRQWPPSSLTLSLRVQQVLVQSFHSTYAYTHIRYFNVASDAHIHPHTPMDASRQLSLSIQTKGRC